MTDVLEVAVGTQLWFEGTAYQVDELRGGSALLSGRDHLRRVSMAALLRSGANVLDDGDAVAGDPRPSVELLASLDPRERRRLESAVTAITDALEQGDQDSSARLAESAGISIRTARRRIKAFTVHGPAGLVDQRRVASGRVRDSSAEWDEACREVLTGHRDLSTPSIGLVIEQTNSLTRTRFAGISLPSRATAYRRVRELTAGSAAFGSTKRRRSDAELSPA